MVDHLHRHIHYLLLLLVLSAGVSLRAQTIEVHAPSEVEQGRPFTITYQIKNYNGDLRPIDPKSDGLELLYGPARSKQSSVSIYNGQVTSSSDLSFTYTFLAASAGRFSVSGFKLQKEDGDYIPAKACAITALASRSGQASVSRAAKGYFYRTIVPRTSVYEQEALPVSYRIYAASRFGIIDAKPPIYDGFISQSTEDRSVAQLMREDYQGATYQTADIVKEILFPQRAGALQIPSAEITLQIPIEVDDDPFLGQMMERKLRTSPQTITVKPLPEQGKPEDFSGAVGKFKVKASLSSTEFKTNEAVTLTYQIEGVGNLKIAKIPTLSFTRELEAYDPSDATEQKATDNIVQARRSIQYNVIPRHTGKYELPILRFSFFNPTTQTYESVSTEPITISVTQGRNIERAPSVIQHTTSPSANTPYGLLSTGTGEGLGGLALVTSWFYPMIYIALLFFFFIALKWLSHYRATRADILGYSASRAKALATKRLRLARKYADAGQANAFYEELVRALWGYMGDKLRLPTSELSRSNVREHLEAHDVDSALTDSWIATIDAVEFARFAPSQGENTLNELYERASDTIMRIEGSAHLKRKQH